MDKKIEIVCKTDGTYEIEALGFNGNGCEEATREFEKALGNEDLKRNRKVEYYNVNATTQQTNRVNGG